MPLSPILSLLKAEKYLKKEIAEIFTNCFVNIGPNLAASTPENKTTLQNYIHCGSLYLSTINLTDLELANPFASRKTNETSGYDDMPADVVKRVSHEIFVILKHILKQILHSCARSGYLEEKCLMTKS